MLAGVAGGLADYFNVDPVLIRIAFGITALMGVGLLAYLALYIFVPEDDGHGNPVPASTRDRVIAAAVLLVVLIAVPGGLFPVTSLDWWWGVSFALAWLAILAGAGYGIYWLLTGGWRSTGRGDAAPGDAGASGTGASDASDTATTAVMPQPGSGPPSTSGAGPQATTAASRETSAGRVLVMIVAFAALAFASLIVAFTSAWGAAVGGGAVVAIAVILAGILIALAAFFRPVRWLIVPALALALPAAAVEATGYALEGGYGDRLVRPARLADIPEDGYRMAAGNLVIDLRQADWRPDSVIELPAKLNFGRLAVVVPEGVCVSSDVDVWAGGFEILGETDSHFGVHYRRTLPESASPILHFDGDVDMGWVEVLTRMPDDHFDRDRGWFGDDRDWHRDLSDPDAKQPAHCLRESETPRKGETPHKNERAAR